MLRTLAAATALALTVLAGSPSPAHAGTSSWEVVPGPPVPGGGLNAVSAVSASDAWAVGFTGTAGPPLTEHWNGTNWSVVKAAPAGFSSYLVAVSAASAKSVWAVGQSYTPGSGSLPLIEHWNGAKWSIQASPPGVFVYGVAAVPGTSRAWAVGSSDAGPAVLGFNGQNWRVAVVFRPRLGAVIPLAAVTALSASDAWAIGSQAFLPTQKASALAVHWNGTSWTKVPTPPVQNTSVSVGLVAVNGAAGDDVWAVGSNSPPSGPPVTSTEHWNGTSWTIVPSPSPGTYSNQLCGAAVLSPTRAWAVGTASNGNPAVDDQTLIELWNGSAWRIVPSPAAAPASGLMGAAPVPGTGQAWAVGFMGANGQPGAGQPLIERTG